MNDLAYLDPPVEVVATSPRLEMILSRLRSGRMRPFRASAETSCAGADAVLLDVRSTDAELIQRLAEQSGRNFRPVLLLGEGVDPNRFSNALVIPRDRDLSVLRGRLEALSRRSARMSELDLRARSAAAFGISLPEHRAETVPDLLYLGDGSARFLALQAALGERGIAVTAAFSLHTAQDYLRQKRFAAFLIDLTPDMRHSERLAEWLAQARPRAEATPLFGLVEPGQPLSGVQMEIANRLVEVFQHGSRLRDLATHIEMLGRQHVDRTALSVGNQELAPITDPETGLFSSAFFQHHLDAQIALASDRGEALSIIVLRDPANDPLSCDERARISGLILSTLRETDTPAALPDGSFAISLPATAYKGAAHICDRLFRQMERVAPALCERFGWRITEKRAYHDADSLLTETVSGVYQKSRAS